MSKRRKPPQKEGDREDAAEFGGPARAEAQLLGNLAAQAQLTGVPGPGTDRAAADLAHRASLALRVAPRDGARTGSLVALVSNAVLPEGRALAVVQRLEADQTQADEIQQAITESLGVDGPDVRSALIGGFDDAVLQAEAHALPAGASAELRVGVHVAAQVAEVTPERAAHLGLVLSRLFRSVWDEEEEEAPAGDYAAEESGV